MSSMGDRCPLSFLNLCTFHLPLQAGAIVLGSIDIALSGLTVGQIMMQEHRIIKDTLVNPYHLILIDVAVCLVLATQILRRKLLLPWVVGQLITIVSTLVLYIGYYALGSHYWPLYIVLSSVIVLFGVFVWNCLLRLPEPRHVNFNTD